MWAAEALILALLLAAGVAGAEEPRTPDPAPDPVLLEFIGSWSNARGGEWLETLEMNAWIAEQAHNEGLADLQETKHD